MVLLTMDTEHHHFEACGNDETEARQALEKALNYYDEGHLLSKNWWRDYYDINTLVIEPGECFCDGQLLYRSK